MEEIRCGGFTLQSELHSDGGRVIRGYEGSDPVLDLTGNCDITVIDRKAFLSCKGLKKVFLPAGIRLLDEWAFSKCSNLKNVRLEGAFAPGILGKGAFKGCDSLSSIRFAGMDEDTVHLLALCANLLENDHLLRADDVGSAGWYEKWDLYLLSVLATDDAEGSSRVALCGEEDISYDGVGMVDGEMPGETEEYVRQAARNKCLICFKRLKYASRLSEATRKKIGDYLSARSFGSARPYAWQTLTEDLEGDPEYFGMYLDIVDPDAGVMDEMIRSLNSTRVQARAYLIGEAAKRGSGIGGDAFDDLFL